MNILSRLRAAFYCLFFGSVPVPVSDYRVVCISDETLLFSKAESTKSVEVALWALERPDHYWKATMLGSQVHEEVQDKMGFIEEEDE